MRIQHNITAMNAYRNYNNNTSAISKNLEKLSSGYKINRAGDDAAGLAVSQKMRLQIAGLAQAQKNAKSGISYIQTAEGALQEVHEMLERMYTLAEQSANGTFDDDTDRVQLQKEVNNLIEEIDRIGKTANFNGMGIFAEYGSGGGGGGEALTADDITNPTSAAGTAVQADGTNAGTVTFDLADTAFAKDGTVTVTVAGKGYDVDVTEAMTDEEFAAALATAFNADKVTDGTAGALTASTNGTEFILTGTNKTNATDFDAATKADIAIAPKEAGASLDTTDAAGDLADFDIESIDFGEVEVNDGDDVKVSYNGTDKKLTVTIGSTAYTSDAFTDNAGTLTGDVTLKDASNNEITVSLAATTTNIGADKTADIAEASVGKVKAAGDGDGGGNRQGGKDITFWVGAENLGDNKLTLKKMYLSHDGIKMDKADKIDGTKEPKTVDEGKLTDLDITKADEAMKALDKIETASNAVSDMRGTLGAMQNRLDHTIKNLSVMQENMQDAESVIRDTDVAEEMMAYTKNNILVQSAQAMLAQANQIPQGVLQLLG